MEDIKNTVDTQAENEELDTMPVAEDALNVAVVNAAPKKYKRVVRRVKRVNVPVDQEYRIERKQKQETEPVSTKPVNKVKRTIIIATVILAVIVGIAFVGKMFINDVAPAEPEITVTKPVNMDGATTIGQYSVNVYKNIIVGKNPFVFNNAKTNDAELCYTVMLDGEELFTTGFLAPGAAISWLPENIKEHGRTYNCHVIVTAKDLVTGEELNSLDIRQLIYIDKNLPQTTSPSDFKYTVVVDNYSKATVIDGVVNIGYEVAVHENPAHPLKAGDKIDVRVPETVIVKGNGEEKEVTTGDFEVKECTNKYIYMVGYSVVEDCYDIDRTMTTRYNISGYERHSNGVFDFGE